MTVAELIALLKRYDGAAPVSVHVSEPEQKSRKRYAGLWIGEPSSQAIPLTEVWPRSPVRLRGRTTEKLQLVLKTGVTIPFRRDGKLLPLKILAVSRNAKAMSRFWRWLNDPSRNFAVEIIAICLMLGGALRLFFDMLTAS